MSRTHPLLHLTLARLRLFYREPSSLFWSFGFPLLITMVLGVAFRTRPPDPVPVAVVDAAGREAVEVSLGRSADLQVLRLGRDEARAALRTGKVAMVVVPGAPPTYEIDPSRPESRLARALVDDAAQRGAGRRDAFAAVERRSSEPGSRYIDFFIPGLIGLNLLSSGLWGVGYVIVEDRTRKRVKRLLATPMRRSHYLLSLLLTRLLFVAVELPLLLGFARLAFDIHVRGSLLLLVSLAVLGTLAFAALGLLIASRAQNTHTVGGLINLLIMPMWVGSGVFFSVSRFPEAAQPFLRLLPLTALNDSMRAVINEGAGIVAVAPQALLLAVVAVLGFLVGLRIFRWQ